MRSNESDVLPWERLRGGQLLLREPVSALRSDESGVLPGEFMRRGQRVFGEPLSRVRLSRTALLRRGVPLARAVLGEPVLLTSPSGAFAFEAELYETLEFMPLPMRYRLDVAGLKLSLAAWQLLAREEREALCAHPVESANDIARFVARVTEDAAAVDRPVTALAPETSPPSWSCDATRDAVIARAQSLGARLEPARWEALTDLQRYALAKVSAPGKRDDRLLAALAELA